MCIYYYWYVFALVGSVCMTASIFLEYINMFRMSAQYSVDKIACFC